MEWLVGAFFLLMFGLCALMMLSMLVRGWLGVGRHRGHGTMMCMGHGADDWSRTPDRELLEELKAERERLEALIAGAGRDAPHRPG